MSNVQQLCLSCQAEIKFLSLYGYKLFLKKPIVKIDSPPPLTYMWYRDLMYEDNSFCLFLFFHYTSSLYWWKRKYDIEISEKENYSVFPFNNKNFICFVEFTVAKQTLLRTHFCDHPILGIFPYDFLVVFP